MWIIYYTSFGALYWSSKFPFVRSFFSILPEVFFSTPLDMIFCYSIIYFLLPKFLFTGRYIRMTLLWLLFSVLFIIAFQSYTVYVIPVIRKMTGMPPVELSKNWSWAFLNLFYQINMEGGLAAAIKLGKLWFIKQRELDLIKAEKQKLERGRHDGQLQSVFLVNALDRVEMLSVRESHVIPAMIKKIKNLLLYVIYDHNQASVSLEKELRLLEEYLELEEMGSPDRPRILLKRTGDPSGEQIAPFILLPLVENSFRQLSLLDLPDKYLRIDIHILSGSLNLQVAWSKPIDTSTLANGGNIFLQHIGNRLDLLYPESHELKVFITTAQFLIDCKINLHNAIKLG
ncbi:MAG: histidine kinase [Puia sp.]|nr:histidine kinase [Puia sp.]